MEGLTQLTDEQEDFMRELRLALSEFPYLRIGQTLVNALGTDPYYMADDHAVQKLRAMRRDNL